MESKFLRIVTVFQISVFLVVAIALSQYKNIHKVITDAANEQGLSKEEKDERLTMRETMKNSRFSTLVNKLSIKNTSL